MAIDYSIITFTYNIFNKNIPCPFGIWVCDFRVAKTVTQTLRKYKTVKRYGTVLISISASLIFNGRCNVRTQLVGSLVGKTEINENALGNFSTQLESFDC